ncbi:hypothetical protein PPACK8108_LOCUS24715 [Phakopsora pachyrhizi]|uniref:Uncharacterized protein n=1 Tax=Phakopsora pachyrhizi TaxID=170000 RepID=A0AAV0BQF0_PHAPC|nr:hypothetical protein PPACK8108_LOCUS24715 [Phakopsora pachyrhizi]
MAQSTKTSNRLPGVSRTKSDDGCGGGDEAEMIPDEVWEVLGGNLPYKKIVKPSVEAVRQIGKYGSKTGSDKKTTVPVESGVIKGVSGAIALQKTFKDEGWNQSYDLLVHLRQKG